MNYIIRPPDGQDRYVSIEEQLPESERAAYRQTLKDKARELADLLDRAKAAEPLIGDPIQIKTTPLTRTYDHDFSQGSPYARKK